MIALVADTHLGSLPKIDIFDYINNLEMNRVFLSGDLKDHEMIISNSDEMRIPEDSKVRSAIKLRNGAIYWTSDVRQHMAILQECPIYLSEVASCGFLTNGIYHDSPDDELWLSLPDLMSVGIDTLCNYQLAWDLRKKGEE